MGKTYNWLTILSETVSHRKWSTCVLAKCKCGNIKSYVLTDIKKGHTKSCGCIKKITFAKVITKHGLRKHPLYTHWAGMRQRCIDKNFTSYKYYGGRGIMVCKSWLLDFKRFHDWSLANGWAEGLSLDRKNNNGNYTPSNCRWVGVETQARNTRANIFITYKGVTKCMAEWEREKNMIVGCIGRRINVLKWAKEKALTEPVRKISLKR